MRYSELMMAVEANWIWMDGELIPFDQARVHVLTHTLHYGYGVFEGIRAYARPDGSHVFRLGEHIRLHGLSRRHRG